MFNRTLVFALACGFVGCTYYSAIATDGKNVFVTRQKGFIFYNGTILSCVPRDDGLRCVEGVDVVDSLTGQTTSGSSGHSGAGSAANGQPPAASDQPDPVSKEQKTLACDRVADAAPLGWEGLVRENCLGAFKKKQEPFVSCALRASSKAEAKPCIDMMDLR